MNKETLLHAKIQAQQMMEEIELDKDYLLSEDKELFCFLMEEAIENIDRKLT